MAHNREHGDPVISKAEAEQHKKIKSLDLGQTEKDYLLELALMFISSETKNELVFKGGTCLYKFNGLNRFSEDLDFSAVQELDYENFFRKILKRFGEYGVKGKIKTIFQPYNTILASLQLEGPLYDGNPLTFANIKIDINKKSEVLSKTSTETLRSSYREIIPFNVLCMDTREIATEKIRAIITRDKARDIYDLWFLIKKGVPIDYSLLARKMDYYNLKFDRKTFESRLNDKEADWENDLRRLIFGPLPDFKTVKKEIMDAMK